MVMHADTNPWYKQFWPCFLIGILLFSSCVTLIMVAIAVKSSDGLVKDNYYKKGLAINQVIAQDQSAAQLDLQAEITLKSNQPLSITLFSSQDIKLPNSLQIDFIFPTKANRDVTLHLSQNAQGHYQTAEEFDLEGHWYIEVKPNDASWRLTGEVFLPSQSLLLLKPIL